MTFAHPWILAGLILPIAWLVWRLARGGEARSVTLFPSCDVLPARRGWRTRAHRLLPIPRALAAMLLIAALARPLYGEREEVIVSEGIDIILALDTSGSMRAEDFQPDNRLQVAKRVARSFVEGRRGDRIGLVLFASAAYTQCPLTSDHPVILRMIDEVDFGGIKDGTAVGSAIATAANRFREAGSRSRVLILLTDGRNNAGSVDPITAAKLARAVGVRVHTIAAGGLEDAPYPVQDPIFGTRYVRMPVQIDEETLKEVARLTGGEYFRATDAGALETIYERIDQMEKTRVETRNYVDYSEFGASLLPAALVLLLAELLLGIGPLRKLP